MVAVAIWITTPGSFLIVELKVREPMLDLSIFRSGHLSVNVITGFLNFFSIAGMFILMPYYLINVLKYSPRSAGFLLSVVPLSMGIVAPRAGRLSDRWGIKPLTLTGLIVPGIGYRSASTLTTETTAAGFVIRFLPIGIGMGIFQAPNNSAVMGSVPRNRLGVASGLLSITRTLGQTVGVSVQSAIRGTIVLSHTGSGFNGTPTIASRIAQVEGFRKTFLLIAAVIALGFLFALGGAFLDRGRKKAQQNL